MSTASLPESPLLNPFVLRSAWHKVQAWYRSVEWAPEPEYTLWTRNPWARLELLATELMDGSYVPEAMVQVPYPKNAEQIRHYVVPTVKDQVAQMIFAVLFAPFIEFKSTNVSLGGRWYRPLRRVKRQWESGSFSLSHREPYQPYRKSYGLFRRLAHWTVNRWLGEGTKSEAELTPKVTSEDYATDTLPYLGSQFRLEKQPAKTLCYARLDLKAAYPSLSRKAVCESLLALISDPQGQPDLRNYKRWGVGRSTGDFRHLIPRTASGEADLLQDPWTLLFENGELRMRLLDQWISLIQAHEYLMDPEFGHLWCGELSQEQAKSPRLGIPTGLAISPLLMNAALTYHLDYKLLNKIQKGEDCDCDLSLAYLRFVDDLILISNDEQALERTILDLRIILAGIPKQDEPLEPKLNDKKAKPDSVKGYLTELAEHKSGQPEPRLKLRPFEKITVENQGEFVTELVERMSQLGEFRLGKQFGLAARSHLQRLHELARWNIGDLEVREDTRIAFAVNRLATARIPESIQDSDKARDKAIYNRYVKEIRHSAVHALQHAPQKFSLWRSIIRASLYPDSRDGKSFHLGQKWLLKVIERIRWVTPPSVDGNSEEGDWAESNLWSRMWPTHVVSDTQDETDPKWKAQVAFHQSAYIRAHFWKTLTDTISSLCGAAHRHKLRRWNVEAWHYRVMNPERYLAGLKAMRKLESVAKVLYKDLLAAGEDLPRFELQALVEAVIQALPGRLLSKALHSDITEIPLADLCKENGWDVLAAILAKGGADSTVAAHQVWQDRLQRTAQFKGRDPLVSTSPAQWLGDPVCCLKKQFRFVDAKKWWEEAYKKTFAEAKAKSGPNWSEFFALCECYRVLRELALGYNFQDLWQQLVDLDIAISQRSVPASGTASSGAEDSCHAGIPVTKLLFTIPSSSQLNNWSYAPHCAPAYPLPKEVCLQILWAQLKDNDPYEIGLDAGFARRVSAHRRAQLKGKNFSGVLRCKRPVEDGKVVSKILKVAVPEFPRHPMFLVAERLSSPQRWNAVLGLFLMLEGGESALDRLYSEFPAAQAWSDYLNKRCSWLVPSCVWAIIDDTFNRRALEQDYTYDKAFSELSQLVADPNLYRHRSSGPILSVDLNGSPLGVELRAGQSCCTGYPLQDNLIVRLVQLNAVPSWGDNPQQNLLAPPHWCEGAIHQIVSAIGGTDKLEPGQQKPELLVFPELALHPSWAKLIVREASTYRVGVIAGMYWSAVPTAFSNRRFELSGGRGYVRNEALLAIPFTQDPKFGPCAEFRIPKPRPAHIELGLAQLASMKINGGKRWTFLPGQDWFRFEHPKWGPFSVAICSDLLDPQPWGNLNGSLLHLFLTAWNTDVELYDEMTWTRAYELFCNLVAVNHGTAGGSLAWTPCHSKSKRLLSLHGMGHFIQADVKLPVKNLAKHQALGNQRALEKGMKDAQKLVHSPKEDEFKSTPPGWERKW